MERVVVSSLVSTISFYFSTILAMDTHFIKRLHFLNLGTYITVLQKNDYTSWDRLARISEEEFDRLGFKLGHRRRLQREIASMKGHSLIWKLYRLRGRTCLNQT